MGEFGACFGACSFRIFVQQGAEPCRTQIDDILFILNILFIHLQACAELCNVVEKGLIIPWSGFESLRAHHSSPASEGLRLGMPVGEGCRAGALAEAGETANSKTTVRGNHRFRRARHQRLGSMWAPKGIFTSARIKTRGFFSIQYGRIEFRAEAQGFWPAEWLLGNNIATVNWPACGEMDVLERANATGTPDWNKDSTHGPGFAGPNLGAPYSSPPCKPGLDGIRSA